MTVDDLQKKIATAIADACRTHLYGTLEIEFKAGEPVFLKRLSTEKLDEPGGHYEQKSYR